MRALPARSILSVPSLLPSLISKTPSLKETLISKTFTLRATFTLAVRDSYSAPVSGKVLSPVPQRLTMLVAGAKSLLAKPFLTKRLAFAISRSYIQSALPAQSFTSRLHSPAAISRRQPTSAASAFTQTSTSTQTLKAHLTYATAEGPA